MKVHSFRRLLAVGMAILLCVCATGLGVTAATQTGEEAEPETGKSSLGINRDPVEFRFEKAGESDRLLLEADNREGALRLTDKKTGALWQSSPEEYPTDKIASGMIRSNIGSQLVLRYVDSYGNVSSSSSRMDSLQNGSAKVDALEQGIRVTYTFKKAGVTVPVEYTVDGDCFQASVKIDEITETGEKYRLYTLSLLPYFGTGSTEDEGYMLVPDGSGALIRFNNGKARLSDYSQEIYGRDNAIVTKAQGPVTKTARLPVYGVQKNDSAFLAVIAEGDARTTVNASVSGVQSSYNTVYPEFTYRYFDSVAVKEKNWDSKSFKVFEKQPAAGENFTVRYYPLEADRSDYVGMARRYRQVLTEEQGVEPQVSGDVPPLYLRLFGSLKKTRYFCGIPYTAVVPLTAFDQTEAILRQLKERGVTKAAVHYETWSANSTDRNIPTGLKPCGALGGRKGLDRLMQTVHENGYTLYGDINLNEMTKNRWGYRCKWDSAKGVSQSPAVQYDFLLSTYEKDTEAPSVFYLRPGKVLKAANEAVARLGKLGTDGLAPTTLGQMLYSDFGKNKVDRLASRQMWEEALGAMRGAGSGLLLTDANAYGFAGATDITHIPTDSSHFHVEDETVPFYAIALHGLRSMGVQPVNYTEDPHMTFLKAVELGVGVQFAWTAGNEKELNETPYDDLYNGRYTDWLEDAVDMQTALESALKGLTGQEIVGHRVLENGVVCTSYADGTCVYVNYGDTAAEAGGQTVPAGDYAVVR